MKKESLETLMTSLMPTESNSSLGFGKRAGKFLISVANDRYKAAVIGQVCIAKIEADKEIALAQIEADRERFQLECCLRLMELKNSK